MHDIRMVDLSGQYRKIKNDIDRGIQEVIDNTSFIQGPAVGKFEKNLAAYLNAKHVIGCANGTDALQIALMALDLPEGAEVITPDFTFVATVEVVKLLGLNPVFADVDPNAFNISPESIEALITPKTKAIIPVHLFGQCAGMDAITLVARKHDLYIIEDAAQAIGADYHVSNGKTIKAGTIGDIGTTSFFPSKNLGCFGDGGAIFTNNDELAAKIRRIANHGMKNQYHYELIGVNSRLDTLQAAILDVKLKFLDEYNNARRKAADHYDAAFKQLEEVEIPARSDFSTHIFHQYTLKIGGGKRDALQEFLNGKNIPSKVYYPVPLHVQKPYVNGQQNHDLKVTEQLCMEVLSLPMHTELDEGQLNYISSTVIEFFNK